LVRFAAGTFLSSYSKMQKGNDDLSGIYEAVENAAKVDQAKSVETWGPAAFCRRLRTKLHTTQMKIPLRDRGLASAPQSLNIILFGPAGAGKSSLIYTWWRALSGSSFQNDGSESSDKDTFFAHYAHHSLLQRLALGWTVEEAKENYKHVTGDNLAALPKHGTSFFNAINLTPSSETTCGIAVHDTKGQTFYTPAEEKMAEALLEGKLLPGSTEEKKMYRYWFMLGSFGFFTSASLANSPHVLVLVFDMTLRSFRNILLDFQDGADNELLCLYRKIIHRAASQGQKCFVALTHVDKFELTEDDTYIEDVDLKTYTREADLRRVVDQLKLKLSAALSFGASPIPVEHILALENYRKDKYIQDPVLDLSVLEFLDSVVEDANRFVSEHYRPAGFCIIS